MGFSSELAAWKAVFSLRRKTMIFLAILLSVVMALFLITVWQYRSFDVQLSQLTDQVEVLVEVDRDLPEEQRDQIAEQIRALDGVDTLDFWSPQRAAAYVDQHVFAGYQQFLQKHQLENPLNPLFRIGLTELSFRADVVEALRNRFAGRLEVQEVLAVENPSFAGVFLQRLQASSQAFQVLMLTLWIVFLAGMAYAIAFVLSERSRGFHLSQVLHLSPAYGFWPALLMAGGFSLIVVGAGTVLAALVIGELLLSLAALVWGSVFLIMLLMVWLGRFVWVKWGMR